MNEDLRVNDLLKSRGMTQTDLANKIGISRVGLNKAMAGNTTLATLRKIADALDVPITSLFQDDSFFAVIKKNGNIYSFDSEREILDFLSREE